MDFASIDVKGAEYKKAAILFCYRTTHCIDSAFSLLSKEYPDVTRKDVEAWFTELRLGEIPVPVNTGNQQEKALFSLSPKLLQEITKYLSAQDLKSISQVCKLLKQFVARIDVRIDLIHIFLKPDSIEIKTVKPGSTSLCQITQTPNGCSVNKDGFTTSQRRTFLEQLADEFERCLGNDNRKVKKLDIEVDKESDHQTEFFDKLITTFRRLDSRLDCETLHTDFCPSRTLKFLIEQLSSEHFKDLRIRSATQVIHVGPYDMSEIILLPHWKKLTAFFSFCDLTNISLLDFAHIDCVSATTSSRPTEDIASYILACAMSSSSYQLIGLPIENVEDVASRLLPFGVEKK
ncbi:Protein CBG04470 [Caenorhabditis briggsae]|uniref:F-box domain-containing protein n=2 Tax=Caenorhabditis briggsae TaxID=6238 RepID=A0AAE8ZSG9_CAEBR|nr:Protein CBG04470 [Caenorhabditis briggsae]ULT81275.1 hypothetical protein L3Y34_011271 [Caenorhabditis briggsae]CAP25211.2 Protein CBG04470 [Caenorhabditis briggsae]